MKQASGEAKGVIPSATGYNRIRQMQQRYCVSKNWNPA